MASELRELRKLCEYVGDCSVPLPADLTVAGCTRIELLGVRDSEWSADRNLPLLSVQAHVGVMVIFWQ